jgi:HD-like signal output (HDOD) protein
MTDTLNMLSQVINGARNFTLWVENLRQISDQIGADSSLSAKLATTAASAQFNRSDLVTADFDNLKAAIDALANHLNAAGSSVTPVVNTATVKLAYYKIL